MKRLLALITLAASAWGAQNIALPGSKYKQVTGPTLTSASIVRMVARVNNWTGHYGATTTIVASYGVSVAFTGANTIRCSSFTNDTGASDRNVFIGVSGMTDFIVSCQRVVGQSIVLAEVWNADGTGYKSSFNKAMNWSTAASNNIVIGDNNSGAMAMDLAYVKVFSTVVPPSTAPPSPTLVGDIANYEFESNGNDSSGNAFNLGTTYTNGGTIAYSTTDNGFAPVCNAGGDLEYLRTYRAGTMWTLDGSKVYAASGTTPTYTWQQTSGPNTLRWPDGHKVQSPRVSGSVKGEYVITLTVAADGFSQSCTVNIGSVATDSNGNFVSGTELESVIGSPVRKGKTVNWPLIDDWHKRYLDRMKIMLDRGAYWSDDTDGDGYIIRSEFTGTDAEWAALYAPSDIGGGVIVNRFSRARTYDESWMTAQAGTVTVSGTAVTGTGTSFLSTICNGDGTVRSGQSMLLWHGTGTLFTGYSTPYADPTGKRKVTVSSCASDTALTLASAPTTQTYVKFTGSMQYSVWDGQNEQNFQTNSMPWDYYDTAYSAYAYCYRSGISSYCTLARRIADLQWNLPVINKGTIYDGVGAAGMAPTWPEERNLAYTGMVMRALDGAPEMWPGLDRIAHYTETHETGNGTGFDLAHTGQNPGDLRNDAYRMMILSANYLHTPNATQKASSLSRLLGAYTRWDGVKQTSGNMIWWVQSLNDGNFDYTGTGAQPYMEAMFGQGLEWMARAFDAAFTATGDTQYSTKAANIRASWIPGIGHWLETIGYNTSRGGGLYYARGFGQCEPDPTVSSTDPHKCNTSSAQEARALAMPTIGFLQLAAKYDPTLQALANNLVAGVFGKPGSGSLIEDVNYNKDSDPDLGSHIGSDSVSFSKWLGELCGVATQCAGYEALLNGISSADMQTYNVSLNFPTNTSTRNLTLKLPDGTTTNPTCTSSPCSITIDKRQGGAKLTVDALNASGQTIGSATLDLVVQ